MKTETIIVSALDLKKSETVLPEKKLENLSHCLYRFIRKRYNGVYDSGGISRYRFDMFFKETCYNSFFCATNIIDDEDICLCILKNACIRAVIKSECDIEKLPRIFKIIFWNLCNSYCKESSG